MNSTIAIVASLIGMTVGLCTIASFLLKCVNAINGLKQSNERLSAQLSHEVSELQHAIERQELIINGYKERLEHVTARITATTERITTRLNDTENFLQKTTAFELRSNR